MANTIWDKFRNFLRQGFASNSGKFVDPIDYSSRRQNKKRDNGKLQGDRSGFPEWLQKYAGMGLNSNGEISSDAIGRGKGFSNTQLAEMQYNHDEAQLDRDWNERMYNMYQSPEAQMRQYQDAGLNPALMYQGGVDINGPSGGSAASVSGAAGGDTPTNSFEQVMGVMSQFMNMITGASNIGNQVVSLHNQSSATRADNALKDAQTEQTKVETNNSILKGKLQQIELDYKRQFYDLDIKEQEERIENLKKQGKKILSDIDVNNSVIELNGAQIDLTRGLTTKAEKECALLTSQTLLTNLEREKMSKLMPYVEAREKAELALTYATTDAEKADAEKKLAEAGVAVMNVAREQKIIDSGYYEERVKGMKSERRRAVADCVIGNICDVAKTTIGVVTGTAALSKPSRTPIEAPTVKPNQLIGADGTVLYGLH